MAAQVAHAAVSASNIAYRIKPIWFKTWMGQGQKKIVVKGNSFEILKLKEKKKV